MLAALAVFSITGLANVLWVLYVRRTSQGRPLSSAILSASVMLIQGMITLCIVSDPMLLIPAGIASFVFTYLTVLIDNLRSE